MLTYRLETKENGHLIFLYFPEGNESAPGRVMLSDDDEKVLQESTDDFKQYYAMHALRGIDRNSTNGTVAWY